jgi:hypothetical protein
MGGLRQKMSRRGSLPYTLRTGFFRTPSNCTREKDSFEGTFTSRKVSGATKGESSYKKLEIAAMLGLRAGTALFATAMSFVLAACGNNPGAGSAIPTGEHAAANRTDARSWMSPQAKGSLLLYFSDYSNGVVYAYAYPAGVLVGAIYGAGVRGMCRNKSGQIWIVNANGYVKLYAAGGWTPLKFLQVKGYDPLGCAVDPKSGNLAISNLNGTQGGQGSITIFPNAAGKGTRYLDSTIYNFDFVAYDLNGNLFADGQDNGNPKKFHLTKFSGGKFTAIALKGATINFPGGVQFVNKTLTVGDQAAQNGSSIVYRMYEDGQVLGSTVLTGSADCVQYFIYQSSLVCPNISGPNASLYAYPAGGKPTKTLPGNYVLPIGSLII